MNKFYFEIMKKSLIKKKKSFSFFLILNFLFKINMFFFILIKSGLIFFIIVFNLKKKRRDKFKFYALYVFNDDKENEFCFLHTTHIAILHLLGQLLLFSHSSITLHTPKPP